MTFDEAKDLLMDMRAAKRRANAVKARIADLESDYESIRSALSGDCTGHGGGMVSRVEQLAVRVIEQRERHIAALEAYFRLEDKLATAIEQLAATEQEIIIAYYMDGKPHWQVAQDLNYSIETIKRRKISAIRNITKKL